jgi:hypothetical protein
VHTKYQFVTQGVQRIARQNRLPLEAMAIWIDRACIDQTNLERQMGGISSLITYAARSVFVLVPVPPGADAFANLSAARHPMDLVNYGERAWCRCEIFVFLCIAEMCELEASVYGYTAIVHHHRRRWWGRSGPDGLSSRTHPDALTCPAGGGPIPIGEQEGTQQSNRTRDTLESAWTGSMGSAPAQQRASGLKQSKRNKSAPVHIFQGGNWRIVDLQHLSQDERDLAVQSLAAAMQSDTGTSETAMFNAAQRRYKAALFELHSGTDETMLLCKVPSLNAYRAISRKASLKLAAAFVSNAHTAGDSRRTDARCSFCPRLVRMPAPHTSSLPSHAQAWATSRRRWPATRWARGAGSRSAPRSPSRLTQVRAG